MSLPSPTIGRRGAWDCDANRYHKFPARISLYYGERQRKDLVLDDLLVSIKARGVIQPIVVTEELVLVCGERRLAASIKLGLHDIPARFASELDPIELQIIELEENLKRKDLSWEDQTRAIVRIHSLYQKLDSDWTQKQTADSIGLATSTVSMMIGVGTAAIAGNERIAKATGWRQAHNTLAREVQRKNDTILADLTESITRPAGAPQSTPVESIITEDFLSWAPLYDGPLFNFLHCDFPFGIGIHSSDQGNADSYGAYADDPNVYWALLECLAANEDRLLSSSAHMMFWFSMKYYCETRDFFAHRLPEWTLEDFPLVWLKSDNKGILPDPKRGPRRIYETCFFASRGDRLIVRAVANAYAAPCGAKSHQSEKPEPVLRHFMQMFVDEHTRLLDPTVGSGSALRAAESLHASYVFGLERDPVFAENARTALRNFRTLRAISK